MNWDRKKATLTLGVAALVAVLGTLYMTSAHRQFDSVGTEARVVAFKHDATTVEFGIEYWDRDAETWHYVEPVTRFLRSSAPERRWLSSSPVPIQIAVPQKPVAYDCEAQDRDHFQLSPRRAGDVCLYGRNSDRVYHSVEPAQGTYRAVLTGAAPGCWVVLQTQIAEFTFRAARLELGDTPWRTETLTSEFGSLDIDWYRSETTVEVRDQDDTLTRDDDWQSNYWPVGDWALPQLSISTSCTSWALSLVPVLSQ